MLSILVSPAKRLILLGYALLWTLALPFLPLLMMYKARFRDKRYGRHIPERFAWVTKKVATPIWIHTVSLGESRTFLPVLEALLVAHPEKSFLITTTTPTGRAVYDSLCEAYPLRLQRVYAPLDNAFIVRAFLRRFRPRALWLLETEVWPAWLDGCQRAGIPVTLLHARLSEKSARAYGVLGALSLALFYPMATIITQSPKDKLRFEQLGYRGSLFVFGSLKADMPPPKLDKRLESYRARFEGRLVLCAGSTRKGDEAPLITTLLALAKEDKRPLLIWIPRHLDRVPSIEKALDSVGLSWVRHSQYSAHGEGHNLPENTAVYIADVMGESAIFYALSKAVWMGGSFAGTGGQNPLEPIALQKPVLMGPSYYNFESLVDELKREEAIELVESPLALANAFLKLAESEVGARYCERASAYLAREKGARARYIEKLAENI